MSRSNIWASCLVASGVMGAVGWGAAASAEEPPTRPTPAASARTAGADAVETARALRRAGRDDDALSALRRARASAKGDRAVTVEWEIARTHIAKREFRPAMSRCKAMAKLPNGALAGHVCAAEAHLLWRRGSEALAELEAVERAKAAPPPEVLYFAKLAEGRARELDSRETDAEALYREAIRLEPSRADAHVRLGTMLRRGGKDGLGSLRRAVELAPDDPVAQYELGQALVGASGTRKAAVVALEKAVAERPSYVEALRSLTEAYLLEARLEDAKKTAASVLRLAPTDVLAHVVSGRVALAEGRADEALERGNEALGLMANDASAKLLVADAYAKKGEIDLALEAYQQASGLNPLDPTALVHATGACISAKRLTSAKAFALRAVADFPDHAPAWVAHGDALAADGDAKAARAAYETAKKAKGADLAAIDAKLSRLR